MVPDRKNAARFLVKDGLDAVLELLQVGCFGGGGGNSMNRGMRGL